MTFFLPPVSGILPTKLLLSSYHKTEEKASYKTYFADDKRLILSKNT